jgi:predicted transcriptional regulator
MENALSDLNETLVTLTSDIVAAHVSNNDVTVTDLPALISNVYGALAGLGKTAPVVEEVPLKPAVSIRSSVKPDRIVCLDCGMELKMLKRHLMTHHSLSPDQYRSRWNLGSEYPLVAPEYA